MYTNSPKQPKISHGNGMYLQAILNTVWAHLCSIFSVVNIFSLWRESFLSGWQVCHQSQQPAWADLYRVSDVLLLAPPAPPLGRACWIHCAKGTKVTKVYQATSNRMQCISHLQSEVARLTQAHADMECALHLDSVCIASRLRGLCTTYQDFIPAAVVQAMATEIVTNHGNLHIGERLSAETSCKHTRYKRVRDTDECVSRAKRRAAQAVD